MPDVDAGAAPAVELIGIHKYFGANHANRGVDLTFRKGSIHGLVGENGAGKSTLMAILYGFLTPTSGVIRIDGREVRIASPRVAIALGIGMVHQHFMLVEALSVIENIMLGAEGGALLARGEAAMRARLKHLAETYRLAVDPDARVEDLGVGMRQRVEILKALARDARVLILDEPTAVLTPAEADGLFAMLRRLRDEGRTIILVTHKLREIMDVTDRVAVMRRGALVGDFETRQTSPAALADAMVGRKVALKIDKRAAAPGRTMLSVSHLDVYDDAGAQRIFDVSFDLKAGEIVGVAGVAGNGQSELLEALAGMRSPRAGSLVVDGEAIERNAANPRAMRARGVLHVPEDRLREGLVPPFEACESAMLGFQHDEAYGTMLLDRPGIEASMAAAMEDYDVRPRDPRLATRAFSGGNQQKIVLAREIERRPKVLLIGQPTRGVDIGAIEFIHKRLVALRDAGAAILLVSVELDEIMALADRILVICAGRITGERRPEETDARDLGLLMAGVTERAHSPLPKEEGGRGAAG